MMRKLSIFVQWVFILAAIWFVGGLVLRRPPEPEYEPKGWRSWEGVTVISYAGIAREDEPMYPSVERLEEHLEALRGAGYQTVRPEDVRAFLDGQAPLPGKALLILFEGGRKEALVRATPRLQEVGFMGVIAMPTGLSETWGGFYLKKSDLKRIGRLAQWQLGSMGHDAYGDIPVDAEGTEGRFLTRRRWQEGRLEDAQAYQARVLNDYARSAEWIKSTAGQAARLYLYPYADDGRFPGADPMAEETNRLGVREHFELAFVGGEEPYNGPGSDPWSLTRLRVRGDWTGEELLAELARSRPRRESVMTLGQAEDWGFEREGVYEEERLVLSSGAAGWLRGTDHWSDVDVVARLRIEEEGQGGGHGSLYARYAGPRSWVRVSLAPDGLRVQERLGRRTQTLHFQEWTRGGAVSEGRVRLRLRNNRAWVWLDDEEVVANLPLAAGTRRGRLGFGAEGAEMAVQDLGAELLPARLVLANSIRLVPEAQRSGVRTILPVWFRAEERIRIAETHRKDLMRAAVEGIETIPVVSGGGGLSSDAAGELARQIDREIQEQGLQSLLGAVGVEGPADELAAALREQGYRVVHLLDAEQAARRGGGIARLGVEDWIVINEPGAGGEGVLNELLRHLPADRIALSLCKHDDDGFGPELRTALMANQFFEKE